MNKTKTLLALAVISSTMLLTACGGGGGGSDSSGGGTAPSANLMSGRAIDGYIVGAKVFYDYNMNGIHDADEPHAITEENGVFVITGELTEEQQACFDYVPMIVDVPVGAIDEDLGEVTEAYTLSFPPAFVFDYDLRRDGANITPISTILWESAVTNIQRDLNQPYTCGLIKDDAQVQQAVGDTMRNVTGDLVWHLNVTEEELWDDYIASGNVEMYEIAQDLMIAIRKGFDETYELSLANPGAHVNVAYYPEDKRDTGAEKGDWYKSVAIRKDGNLTETVHRINDEWEIDTLLMVQTEAVVASDLGDVLSVHEYRTHTTKGFLDYICSVSESIAISDRISYEIENGTAPTGDDLVGLTDDVWSMENKATTYDLEQAACLGASFDTTNADSYLMNLTTARYTAVYDEEYTKYKWNSVPVAYAHLVGFSNDLANFDVPSFIADLTPLPRTKLGGQQTVGADWWEHVERYIDTPNKVSAHKTNSPVEMPNGQLSYDYRFISHPGGTYAYTCAVGDGSYADCTK